MISTLMVQIGNHKNIKLEETLLRHMILNTIRAHNVKFRKEFGEMVIACDDRHYWRKEVFPYYKSNRKRDRDASELDWNALFEILNRIREEIKEYLPYKVIHVEHAEADDIIASLAKNYHRHEPIMILSGDKDFSQLQKYPGVKQYSPIQKKNIVCNDPESFLKEHIIRGDVGDGVPNMLSADNVFVLGVRQTPISAKKLQAWMKMQPEDFCTDATIRNYKRNEQMVDLDFVPVEIERKVLEQYTVPSKTKVKLFDYFVSRRLNNLMEFHNDF